MPQEKSQNNKKMSLFGGLIYEGLDGAMRKFMELSRDQQVEVVESLIDTEKQIIQDIVNKTHSIHGEMLRELLMALVSEWLEELEELGKIAKDHPVKAFFRSLTLMFRMPYEIMDKFFVIIFTFLRNLFEPTKPPTFQDAVNNAEKFLTLVGDLNIITTILDSIGRIEVFGTKLPLDTVGRLMSNVAWSFGLGWLTWIVMGPILRASIADPYEQEMTRRLRPKQWSRSEVEDLYEREMVDKEYLRNALIDLGYSDDKIELLLDLIDKKIIESEARSYATYVESNYVDGYATEDDLVNAYALGNYTKQEIAFKLWKAQQRLINKLNDLRVKEIERAFKEGYISEDEARARLSEFIKTPEMIERLVSLWKQYRRPEEEVEAVSYTHLTLPTTPYV